MRKIFLIKHQLNGDRSSLQHEATSVLLESTDTYTTHTENIQTFSLPDVRKKATKKK